MPHSLNTVTILAGTPPQTGSATGCRSPKPARFLVDATAFMLAHHPAAQVAYAARIDAVYHHTTTSIPF
jgi:hypothetical protein